MVRTHVYRLDIVPVLLRCAVQSVLPSHMLHEARFISGLLTELDSWGKCFGKIHRIVRLLDFEGGVRVEQRQEEDEGFRRAGL